MDVSKIVTEIDVEIASLQHARTILLGLVGKAAEGKPRRGRPKGSTNAVKALTVPEPTKAKRKMTPEGRKRIAEAMKRRWAEKKGTAAKSAKAVSAKKEVIKK